MNNEYKKKESANADKLCLCGKVIFYVNAISAVLMIIAAMILIKAGIIIALMFVLGGIMLFVSAYFIKALANCVVDVLWNVYDVKDMLEENSHQFNMFLSEQKR